MRYIFLILLSTLLFASMSDFDQFEQFDKQDKQEFNSLKNKIQKCIKKWDFECAQNDIKKIKRYVTSKKDSKIIADLKIALSNEKYKKQEYEERKRRANAKKSIRIGNCHNGSNGAMMCTLYVNGSYDGNIFYKLKSNGDYDIFILGSKNAYTNSGFYDTNLHRVWTTRCGDSVFGRSEKKFVYDLSKALYMYANCSINGVY